LPAVQSASPPQVFGHIPDTPVHRYAPQDGLPGWPSASGVQTPFAEAPSDCAHTSHAPPQAALQQYPSTQKLLWHWFGAVHAPSVIFGTHWLTALQ
jgi:hypothetical protein